MSLNIDGLTQVDLEQAIADARAQDLKNWDTYARGMAPPPVEAISAPDRIDEIESRAVRTDALKIAIHFTSDEHTLGDVLAAARRFEQYILTGE